MAEVIRAEFVGGPADGDLVEIEPPPQNGDLLESEPGGNDWYMYVVRPRDGRHLFLYHGLSLYRR